MKFEEIIYIIGTIVVILVVLYISFYSINFQLTTISNILGEKNLTREGFNSRKINLEKDKEKNKNNKIFSGVGINSEQYNASIKSTTNDILEHLMIPTYRNKYESIILNLNDYANAEMLNVVLNGIDENKNVDYGDLLIKIGTLQTGKNALNDILKFMDDTNE